MAFVALCPKLDIASQGASIEEARTNLIEALTLFFETASSSEVTRRFHHEVFVVLFATSHGRDNAVSLCAPAITGGAGSALSKPRP